MPSLQIAHRGVVEVEQALSDPDSPTEHFAAISTITIHGNVYGSQIGIAGGDLTQEFTFDGSQTNQLQQFVRAYRDALPQLYEDVRDLATQQLDQVAAELEQSKPRTAAHQRPRVLLESLRGGSCRLGGLGCREQRVDRHHPLVAALARW